MDTDACPLPPHGPPYAAVTVQRSTGASPTPRSRVTTTTLASSPAIATTPPTESRIGAPGVPIEQAHAPDVVTARSIPTLSPLGSARLEGGEDRPLRFHVDPHGALVYTGIHVIGRLLATDGFARVSRSMPDCLVRTGNADSHWFVADCLEGTVAHERHALALLDPVTLAETFRVESTASELRGDMVDNDEFVVTESRAAASVHVRRYRAPGGALLGEFDLPPGTTSGFARPAVFGGPGRLYFSVGEGGLLAVDRSSGRTLWRYDAHHGVPDLLPVGEMIVMDPMPGPTTVLESETGRVVWSSEPGAETRTFLLSNDQVLVQQWSRSLTCIDARTRRVRWSVPRRWIASDVVESGGRVVLREPDRLLVVDSTTGRIEREIVESASAIAVQGTRLVFVVADLEGPTLDHGRLVSVDLDTTQRWDVPRGSSGASSVAIGAGQAFACTDTGELRAFDLDTGRARWRAEIEVTSAAEGSPCELAVVPATASTSRQRLLVWNDAGAVEVFDAQGVVGRTDLRAHTVTGRVHDGEHRRWRVWIGDRDVGTDSNGGFRAIVRAAHQLAVQLDPAQLMARCADAPRLNVELGGARLAPIVLDPETSYCLCHDCD